MGRLVGSGSMENPKDIEDNMVRLICAHPMASDLVYRGAAAVADPFFRAAKRCGF